MQITLTTPLSDTDLAVLRLLLEAEGAGPVPAAATRSVVTTTAPPAEATKTTSRPSRARKGTPAPEEQESAPEAPSEAAETRPMALADNEPAAEAPSADFEEVLRGVVERAMALSKTPEGKSAIRDALQSVGVAKVSAIPNVEVAHAFLEALDA